MSRISGYDRSAVRPLPGSLWVWEPEAAPALIKVTKVFWNGEEWWVKTTSLASYDLPVRLLTETYLNELGRFWGACHHVSAAAGPPPGPRTVTRKGEPLPEELITEE